MTHEWISEADVELYVVKSEEKVLRAEEKRDGEKEQREEEDK